MSNNWDKIQSFSYIPEEILARRESGIVYSADFKSNEGKYISVVANSEEPIDAIIKVSPRVELRLTYIFKEKNICGLQITKLKSDNTSEKIHLSTLDWDSVIRLLHIFSNVDLESIATGSLILDSTIIGDKVKLVKFLTTLATDPEGKKKFEEVAKNIGLLKAGDINQLTLRKSATSFMEKLLDDKYFFDNFKVAKKIGKEEEVWQRFFKKNDWLLGSDVVEILDDRIINEDSTVDLPIKNMDGFLDIIELKLPDVSMWTKDLDPTSDLSKAIMQCMRYIIEYERRFNDHKKIKDLGVDILKPRITLIFGRSKDWNDKMHEQLRIINSSFHNITILTYDHVLKRANRIVECDSKKE